MNLTIFDMALDFMTEKSQAYQHDMTIQFPNLDIIYVSLPVIQQLDFFIFVSSSDIDKTVDSDGKQVFCFVQNELYFPTLKFFSFFYNRLIQTFIKKIPSKTTTEEEKDVFDMCCWNDQLEYIKLLDYLTDPKERFDFGLLTNIKWSDNLWIHFLTNKFDKIEYFFTLQQRTDGCRICVKLLKNKYPILRKLGSHRVYIRGEWFQINDPIYYVINPYNISDDALFEEIRETIIDLIVYYNIYDNFKNKPYVNPAFDNLNQIISKKLNLDN